VSKSPTVTASDIKKLLAEIADAHARVSGEPAAALHYALDAGARLITLKERLERGQFTPALERIGIPATTAQLYMRLARNRERILAAGCKSIREAIRLLAPPKPRATRTSRARGAEPSEDRYQEGYDAGYRAGWRDRSAAEQRAQKYDNGRPRLSVRDLKFALTQLHPDRFHSDESSAKRANRVTAWLLDELKAARS
jgi:hypothetical protein